MALEHLFALQKEYAQKLEDINETISNHPETKKNKVRKGIETLNGLIHDSDYHINTENNSIIDYEEEILHGIEDFRPGSICNLTFTCLYDFVFHLRIEVRKNHEDGEVVLEITNRKLDKSKKYDLLNDSDNNEGFNEGFYDDFVKEFGGIESSQFKPFFKIDSNWAFEYGMYI